MKTKPILLVTTLAIAITTCGFLFFSGKVSGRSDKEEVKQLLLYFKKNLVVTGLTNLEACFKKDQLTEQTAILLNTLLRFPGNGEAMLSSITFDADHADIKPIGNQHFTAIVPIKLSKEGVPSRHSAITFTIQKTADHQYKIYHSDDRAFMTDYNNYENYLAELPLQGQDVYNPITLKAFTSAKQLSARYDSVIWFAHMNDKTWFYVVKGKWDLYKAIYPEKDTAKTYKMGLVNGQFKEIIPADFDLIHNIGATFPGLIEVEKDHSRGFYNQAGKIVVPIKYQQIYPVNDGLHLAALKKGSHFFWLMKDYSISGKTATGIGKVLGILKPPPFKLTQARGTGIMEFNSHREHNSIYFGPSYLTDMHLSSRMHLFENPLRKHMAFGGTETYYVKPEGRQNIAVKGKKNWLQSLLYAIHEDFIDGRSGFYNSKTLVLVDKKHDTAYGLTINTGWGDTKKGIGREVKALNDSLLEVKIQSRPNISLYNNDDQILEMPAYYYLLIKDGVLSEIRTRRQFEFTKLRNINDEYLTGDYLYSSNAERDGKSMWSHKLNADGLEYMINEIYASYNYKFKDSRWIEIFTDQMSNYKPLNLNVDDSLTAIDKYNINFINGKLNAKKANSLAAK